MVVRSGLTTEAELLNAYGKLQRQNANVIGVVMNDIDCPTLSEELVREARRVEKWLPALTSWLVSKVRQSHFLNLPV